MKLPVCTFQFRRISLPVAGAPETALRAHDHLNFLRGVASVAVLAGHARLAFVRDTGDVPHLHLWQKPFYFLTSQGPSAVLVFFVLSGFLIGSSIVQSLATAKWSWRKYLAARFARIYTVLFPALVIGVVIDLVGSHMFGDRPIYATAHYNVMVDQQIRTLISPRIFVGNLLNLQAMYVHTLGSNRPLWSLANEWWYYMLFPLTLIAVCYARRRAVVVVCAALAILIYWGLTPSVRWLFLVWLMGAAISVIPRVRAGSWTIYGSVSLLFLVLVVGTLKILPAWATTIQPFSIGLCSSLLVYLLCSSRAPSEDGIYKKIATSLSKICYSLYVCHMPLIVFITAIVITGQHRLLPDTVGIGATVLLMAVVLAYAACFYYLFESRTGDVRSLIDRVLRKRT